MTQAQIDQAIKDIGGDPTTPLPVNPDTVAFVANSASSSASAAAAQNGARKSIYLSAFQDWANQVLAGKIPNTNPPHPPLAMMAAAGSNGLTYVIQGDQPVCAMPAVPDIPHPPDGMVVAIGSRIALTTFWAALPANANIPQGYTTPQPVTAHDGAVGFFTWVPGVIGGWWEKVG